MPSFGQRDSIRLLLCCDDGRVHCNGNTLNMRFCKREAGHLPRFDLFRDSMSDFRVMLSLHSRELTSTYTC